MMTWICDIVSYQDQTAALTLLNLKLSKVETEAKGLVPFSQLWLIIFMTSGMCNQWFSNLKKELLDISFENSTLMSTWSDVVAGSEATVVLRKPTFHSALTSTRSSLISVGSSLLLDQVKLMLVISISSTTFYLIHELNLSISAQFFLPCDFSCANLYMLKSPSKIQGPVIVAASHS